MLAVYLFAVAYVEFVVADFVEIHCPCYKGTEARVSFVLWEGNCHYHSSEMNFVVAGLQLRDLVRQIVLLDQKEQLHLESLSFVLVVAGIGGHCKD